MPSEIKGDFQIDYSAEPALDADGWTAHVEIFGPNANPMHRTPVIKHQRVLIDRIFASVEEAEQEALKAGLELLPAQTSKDNA